MAVEAVETGQSQITDVKDAVKKLESASKRKAKPSESGFAQARSIIPMLMITGMLWALIMALSGCTTAADQVNCANAEKVKMAAALADRKSTRLNSSH